jgi:hypothetical protein
VSVVEQLGLDFDELHALLTKFMEVSVPSNEDLQSKREQMSGAAEALGTASAGCRASLQLVNEQLGRLMHSAAAEEAHYLTRVEAMHQALQRSSAEWAEVARASLQQAAGLGETAKAVKAATGEVDSSVGKGFSAQAAALTGMRDSLSAGGVNVMSAHHDELNSVHKATKELDEQGAQARGLLARGRDAAQGHAGDTTPKMFGEVQEWVSGDLHRLHLTCSEQIREASAAAMAEFRTASARTAAQAGEEVSRAFAAVGRTLSTSRQRLHQQVSRSTQGLLERLAQNQQSVGTTFGPGIDKAQQCAEQFASVQQHLNALRPHL